MAIAGGASSAARCQCRDRFERDRAADAEVRPQQRALERIVVLPPVAQRQRGRMRRPRPAPRARRRAARAARARASSARSRGRRPPPASSRSRRCRVLGSERPPVARTTARGASASPVRRARRRSRPARRARPVTRARSRSSRRAGALRRAAPRARSARGWYRETACRPPPRAARTPSSSKNSTARVRRKRAQHVRE